MLKNKIKTLWFSDRQNLEKTYIKWIKKECVSDTPFNVITFLQINNLLDIDKVQQFLKNTKKK